MPTQGPNLDSRYERVLATLQTRSQAHALRWWNELSRFEREQLLSDIESIPWEVVDGLIESHVLRKPDRTVPADLSPPLIHPQRPGPEHAALYAEAVETGRERIRAGKVAAFTVAGGQGSRLGVDGPKGAVPVTPVGNRTLFELFAKTVVTARRRYNVAIPWYIMTSPANHRQTVAFLKDHTYFGLPERDVVLFPQGMLPAFDFQGRLVLEAKHRLALAPDGHGGSLTALARSSALADLRSRGIEILSYFQVDNPLVKPFDPLFLGLHVKTGSEMSTKVTPKVDDRERVGNVCLQDQRVTVIEYCDFPDDLAHARNPDGSRKFNAGNLAIHLLDVGFVEWVAARPFRLPFRRAEKAVAFVDESGAVREPKQPNAVKLETFIFDVLPHAGHPMLLAVDRAEEFSPVKNLTGPDSLQTAKEAQIARACRWLEAAGVKVPRKPNGKPDVTVAISPALAIEAEDIRYHMDRLPELRPGDAAYIE